MKQNNEQVVCADGFSMSVQASKTHYCTPRIDNAKDYTSVEVGYPNRHEPLLIEWMDAIDDSEATNAVYGYVPSQRIALVCAKHGGVISGELPAGIPLIEAKNESR